MTDIEESIMDNIDIEAKALVLEGKAMNERGKQWDTAVREAIAKYQRVLDAEAAVEEAKRAAKDAARLAKIAKKAEDAKRRALFHQAIKEGTAASLSKHELVDYVVHMVGFPEYEADYEIIQEGDNHVLYSSVSRDSQDSRWILATKEDAERKLYLLVYWRMYDKYVRKEEIGELAQLVEGLSTLEEMVHVRYL